MAYFSLYFLVFLNLYFFFFNLIGTDQVRKRQRESPSTSQETAGRGEAGSPLNKEPDVQLDPRTPGSWPKPKADAQLSEPPTQP